MGFILKGLEELIIEDADVRFFYTCNGKDVDYTACSNGVIDNVPYRIFELIVLRLRSGFGFLYSFADLLEEDDLIGFCPAVIQVLYQEESLTQTCFGGEELLFQLFIVEEHTRYQCVSVFELNTSKGAPIA